MSIKSAERVMQILDLIAAHPDGLAPPAIASRLAIPKSSLHGLLKAMTDRGYVVCDPLTNTHQIGLRSWEVGQAYSRMHNLTMVARPHLRDLRDELNETVQMAILDGLSNVYIAKEESAQPLRLVSAVGLRLPAHTTALGKVLLAGVAVEELKRRLAHATLQEFTSRTVSDKAELLRRLALVRSRGYGEDDGEYTPGLYCVAVPIQGQDGEVLAAISCSMPSARTTVRADRAKHYLPAMRGCAGRIAAALRPAS